MEDDGHGGNTPRDHDNPDSTDDADGADSAADVVDAGPSAGNRSVAWAFLALMIVLGAALHYYLTGVGSESYLARLDVDLLTHAELTLAAMEDGTRMAVVPTWPVRLYHNLRRDIALYAAFVALAAYVWGVSARNRARRDAFLVHEKLNAEIRELRERLDRLDGTAPPSGGGNDETKG